MTASPKTRGATDRNMTGVLIATLLGHWMRNRTYLAIPGSKSIELYRQASDFMGDHYPA
jgi:hypothetical protein